MARHFPDRSGHIQTEAPKAPPSAVQPETAAATGPNPALPWGWQVALFVWLASFIFLALNDLLTCVFKVVTRMVG
jgi:hypothetical protein